MESGIAARAAALEVLSEVLRRRRPLDLALAADIDNAGLAPRDAGFARAIAGETLRRFGQLEALIATFVPKAPPPHKAGPALEILLMGACELLFLGVAPHASVDAANRLAQQDSKAVHFKPLINAVLRRIAKEGKAEIEKQDTAKLNTPDWLWSRWRETYGDDTARAIAQAHLHPAPLDLHVKTDPQGWAQKLGGVVLGGNIVRLGEGHRVDQLDGFESGDWWVQDFAASLPAKLLGDVKGQIVLDLCAAPGGKTAELVSAGAEVIAVEREGERLLRLRENLQRLGLEAIAIEADVRDYKPDAPAPFVLLDAPCSATGTIRRHPELPWIKSAADINISANAAAELLESAAAMVAPGGLLVFAVCSLEPEEGSEQIEHFLRAHGDFAREAVTADDVYGMAELVTPDGDLRTLPCHLAAQGGMDGFYAARLRRK
ncbi:MAG TPA: transcription antitermination factor NusB [Rhizomicrobium sp.]|jgi:16S rRNA (cytosine967-C5)-methyltransferase|nr:transcription antitermination factor NusB [Rhizomicrobium sp.]